jgi:hypothetical protein
MDLAFSQVLRLFVGHQNVIVLVVDWGSIIDYWIAIKSIKYNTWCV